MSELKTYKQPKVYGKCDQCNSFKECYILKCGCPCHQTSVEEVMIVRLDTDDAKEIEEFQKKWNELKVDIAFVPKHINFKGSEKKDNWAKQVNALFDDDLKGSDKKEEDSPPLSNRRWCKSRAGQVWVDEVKDTHKKDCQNSEVKDE